MNVKQTVQDAADAVAEQMQERRADMKFDARLKAIEKNLGNVDNRIDALGKRFPRRQGPRFPLGLVVIAGVGYALYNPSTRSRILEMLGNVSPAARDTVENAIGKTSDAVAEVQGGRDMASAVKDAARDTVQKTRDVSQDVKNDVQRGVDRLSDRAQTTASNIKQDLKS